MSKPNDGDRAPVHAIVTGQRVKAEQISQRLRDVSDLLTVAKDQAAEAAPLMIDQLMQGGVSLREVARQTKLSPTYLSLVLNCEKFISVGAFHELAKVYESRNS